MKVFDQYSFSGPYFLRRLASSAFKAENSDFALSIYKKKTFECWMNEVRWMRMSWLTKLKMDKWGYLTIRESNRLKTN